MNTEDFKNQHVNDEFWESATEFFIAVASRLLPDDEDDQPFWSQPLEFNFAIEDDMSDDDLEAHFLETCMQIGILTLGRRVREKNQQLADLGEEETPLEFDDTIEKID